MRGSSLFVVRSPGEVSLRTERMANDKQRRPRHGPVGARMSSLMDFFQWYAVTDFKDG